MSTGWIIFIIVMAVIVLIITGLYFAGKKLKDANLPASVMAQVPKISRGIKVPMVKVKIGPQIMTMFCDENIFEQIPVKKEVKATISGNYITGVKGVHGTKLEEKSKKKKGVFKRALEKAQEKAGVKPLK